LRFVRCAPDALPFKNETFFFSTVGLSLSRQDEPLDVLGEIHRATGYSGKVYAPALDLTRARRKPRGAHPWVFDEPAVAAMREMGFGKVQRLRVALLPDGAELVLMTAKRFDPEDAEPDEEADE
jgi:ubiquinone/menaquinone biosynthesis C-methylase UbiE